MAGLENEFPKIKFIPGDSFRNALYPWFDPNTAPREIGELTAILSKTLVKERIEAIGVELLIYMHGDTNQRRFSGSAGGGMEPQLDTMVLSEQHISGQQFGILKIMSV